MLPVEKVLLLDMHGSDCTEEGDCVDTLRKIQNASDLNYNFVVAGDGLTYEGRGWKYRCEYGKYPCDNALVVGLMG